MARAEEVAAAEKQKDDSNDNNPDECIVLVKKVTAHIGILSAISSRSHSHCCYYRNRSCRRRAVRTG